MKLTNNFSLKIYKYIDIMNTFLENLSQENSELITPNS